MALNLLGKLENDESLLANSEYGCWMAKVYFIV